MSPLPRQHPTVLVIDDKPEVLQEIIATLTRAGYEYQCCGSAEEAVTVAQSLMPDLIISEVNLHGHSGLRACERIRQHEALKHIPVMFLSATQIPDIIRRTHLGGGTYHVRIPFDPEVLLELIDRALGAPETAIAATASHPAFLDPLHVS